MANPLPNTLPELIDQLGRTFSPYERLKIVARAWALLRQMSSEQRMIVAAQLGLDRADEVVNAIAERSGSKSSPVLMSMIERAQTKGVAHLPELIADLKNPQRRIERLRESAEAAGTALLEPAKAAPPKPPPPLSRQPPPLPPPAAPAKPAAPPPPAPAAAPKPAPPAPVVAPVVVAPPPPAPAPVVAAPAAPPAPRPAPEPPKAPAAVALAERLAAVPSLTARFRLLRLSVGDAKRLSAADLRTLVDSFPDGWARRRAVLELLRAGVPGKVAEALPLFSALSSERDRAWCLGELIESRDVAEGERETLLATVASPTARRRLERRMG
ncbi:MAG TPA: hypothetical protein VLT87_06405 [Thermoanaerobaculia bacterium]|nr:hypothetical protein [Thermoanaerobaculia bacterium]